jgi:hypothetical protein
MDKGPDVEAMTLEGQAEYWQRRVSLAEMNPSMMHLLPGLRVKLAEAREALGKWGK